MDKPKVLAFIPARGGSKGIPRKNIRLFVGRPLIAYSIAAGVQAELVTRVIVSTDDPEIASVARQYGAELPFMRPDELAKDTTPDLPVFRHALQWLAEHEGYQPEAIVHLRPTSPIRPVHCIDQAVAALLDHPRADSVRGIIPARENPYKMWLIPNEDGALKPLMSVPGIPEPFNAPRQILPEAYWHTGQIDAIRPRTILEKNSMTGETILPLTLDARYATDLDTPDDWLRAEWLALHGGLEMVWPNPRRPMPERIDLLVLDFDGVLTDNRVWTNQDGQEMVASNRSDSEGLSALRRAGIEVLVLSKETNLVVAARCQKLNIPCLQGIDDKAPALSGLMKERGVDPSRVVYAGNDVADMPCFPLVGWGVAVADAMAEVKRQADAVLSRPGGHGAVRELCDLILQRKEVQS